MHSDSSRPLYFPLPCFEELQNVAPCLSVSEHNTCYEQAVRSSQWPFRRDEANGMCGCPCTHRAGVWGVGSLVPFVIHLGVRRGLVARLTIRSLYPRQRNPRYSLNRKLVGSESCVDVLERRKCAAFATNPKCRRGAEVKLHKYYPSVIDVIGQPAAASDWPVSSLYRSVCALRPAVTLREEDSSQTACFLPLRVEISWPVRSGWLRYVIM